MSVELVKRLRRWVQDIQAGSTAFWAMDQDFKEAVAYIEAMRVQLQSTLHDRALILEERDRTFALMLARAEQAEAERERLALAICGGEDAPGYANAQTVETLEHVAKQNQLSHGATINSLLAAEAKNARLREALQSLHGFADGWRECGCGDSCYGRHAERNAVLDHLHDFATAALDGETHDA